jgi:hypothetical protein
MTEPKDAVSQSADDQEDDGSATDAELLEVEPEPATELAADVDEATGADSVVGSPADAPDADVEAETAATVGAGAAGTRRRRGAAAPVTTTAPSLSERAIHIDDRVSKLFVVLTVLVYLAILLNGVFFGVGGLLSPSATPSPSPSAEESPSGSVSASPSVSGSIAPSGSVGSSPSIAPSISVSPAAS